jgi:hypothetical protein
MVTRQFGGYIEGQPQEVSIPKLFAEESRYDFVLDLGAKAKDVI